MPKLQVTSEAELQGLKLMESLAKLPQFSESVIVFYHITGLRSIK
jgi:hypothetical protein